MKKIKLEVADTPSLLASGLMHRDVLPDDNGMLFKFPMLLEASFWGKNTYIPLDIAFLDRDNNITSIKSITPMSTKAIRSDGLCDKAIEVNAGFFKSNGIGIGHKVEFIEQDGKETEALFK